MSIRPLNENKNRELGNWIHTTLSEELSDPNTRMTEILEKVSINDEDYLSRVDKAIELYNDRSRYDVKTVTLEGNLSGLKNSYIQLTHPEEEFKSKSNIVLMAGANASRESSQAPLAVYLYALGFNVTILPQALNVESWAHEVDSPASLPYIRIKKMLAENDRPFKIDGEIASQTITQLFKDKNTDITLLGFSAAAPVLLEAATNLEGYSNLKLNLGEPAGFETDSSSQFKKLIRVIKGIYNSGTKLPKRILKDDKLLNFDSTGLAGHQNFFFDILLLALVTYKISKAKFNLLSEQVLRNVKSIHLTLSSEDLVFPEVEITNALKVINSEKIKVFRTKQNGPEAAHGWTSRQPLFRLIESQFDID